MPKISIDHQTNLPPSEAFQRIKNFFEKEEDIRRLDPNMKCTFAEDKMTGQAKGSQFKADVSVLAQGSGSKVSVVVDLPLLLSPFKGKIQETVQRKLSKHLA